MYETNEADSGVENLGSGCVFTELPKNDYFVLFSENYLLRL